MRFHDLISAFYAVDAFRAKARDLRDHYPLGAEARMALDDALAALDRFGAATSIASTRPMEPTLRLVEAGS